MPLKKAVVEYFYHTWIIVGQRDLYEEGEYTDLLWRITELLVNDLENKIKNDDTHDQVRTFGTPLNESFGSVSDRYIYNGVFLALSAILKLNLKFEERSELLEKIANYSCDLYYKVERSKEKKKYVFDVICTFYNSAAFSKYLDNLKHPLLNEDEEIYEAEYKPRKSMIRMPSKRGQIWYNGAERTRAQIYYSKLLSLTKNEEMKELLEKEFEKMVIWFSKFSDNCEMSFAGFDPIKYLYKMLDPENSKLPVNLHIAGIKILRKIIQTGSKELLGLDLENENGDESEEDEEDLDYSEYISFLAGKG